MNFFKKSKLLLLLVSASLIFSSCGKQADLSLEADAETYNTGAEMRIENINAAAKKPQSGKKSKSPDETLAEGEERDWKIEDVMKNDLEIDGISISIPCTVGELLDTLGKNYSFDKEDLLEERGSKFHHAYLYYKGEKTDTSIDVLFEENTNFKDFEICQIGCLGYSDDAVLTLKGLDGNYNKFLKKYPNPDDLMVEEKGQRTHARITYFDGDYCFSCTFHNDVLGMFDIGLMTGGDENE